MKDQSASGILATAIEKIKDMVDCQTIIGDPIDCGDGIKAIPISKVTYGFASGGSDFPTKGSKELFGGGGGAGVTISPVAFLIINNGEVTVRYINEDTQNSAERVIQMIPEVVNKLGDVVDKIKGKDAVDVEATVFEEE